MLIGTEWSSNATIIDKTHSLEVQVVQLFVERLFSSSSQVFKLVPNHVDATVSRPVSFRSEYGRAFPA